MSIYVWVVDQDSKDETIIKNLHTRLAAAELRARQAERAYTSLQHSSLENQKEQEIRNLSLATLHSMTTKQKHLDSVKGSTPPAEEAKKPQTLWYLGRDDRWYIVDYSR
eukprot:1300448-Rhodomonas_salina.3